MQLLRKSFYVSQPEETSSLAKPPSFWRTGRNKVTRQIYGQVSVPQSALLPPTIKSPTQNGRGRLVLLIFCFLFFQKQNLKKGLIHRIGEITLCLSLSFFHGSHLRKKRLAFFHLGKKTLFVFFG